jgi:hypothetical protein
VKPVVDELLAQLTKLLPGEAPSAAATPVK